MYNVLLSCFHVVAFFIISGHHGHIVFETVHPTPSPKPTVTTTPSATPSPAVSPTAEPAETPTTTPSPSPTQPVTPSPTVMPSATPTQMPNPEETITPSPTQSPTPTPEETPAASPTATVTPTVTPEISVTPSPTPTIMITPTETQVPTPTPTITKIGNDISYPQCGKSLPSNQGFGIVGVNGGIATTTNPCLSTQLLWASQSLGTPNQSKIQLYVNTGNPGGLNTPSWPHDNTDPLGNTPTNPYGTCDGADSLACAWQYGWNRAVDDVEHKFVPSANAVNLASDPTLYPWWLDVETVNSWKEGTPEGYQGNRAVLEAMVSYFTSRGITIGIYSTSYQWGQIVQSVPGESNLNGLRNWRAGGGDLSGAQAICAVSPLTSGGSIVMTQYTDGAFDYDYSCL